MLWYYEAGIMEEGKRGWMARCVSRKYTAMEGLTLIPTSTTEKKIKEINCSTDQETFY